MPLIKESCDFGTDFESIDFLADGDNLPSSIGARNYARSLWEWIESCKVVSFEPCK